MKLNGETQISTETLLTGLLPVSFELPKEIQDAIVERVGALLTEDDIRKLRLQSAEKMREQIRWAVKEHIMKEHIGTLVREAATIAVRKAAQKAVDDEVKKIDLPKMLTELIRIQIENAAGARGKTADGNDAPMAAALQKVVLEQLQEFVKDRMVLRFVDPTQKEAW